MPDQMRAEASLERWDLPGAHGDERWHRVEGQFTSVLVGGKRMTVAEQPFELDQLRLRSSPCGHPGPWPYAFRHCPECGSPLSEPPATWPAAADAPGGLLPAGVVAAPAPDTRREEAMPRSASLCFVVAGAVPHLFAYDLQTGSLHARNEATAQWQDLARLPASRLPRWSWAAALARAEGDPAGEGFALPTDAGPVFVRTGLAAPVLPVAPPPSLGIRRAAGGLASLRGRPAAPVHVAGGLGLARLSAGGEWELAPVSGGEAVPPGAVLAAPAAHADDAFWCSAEGQLSLSLTGGGGWRAEWQPWPERLAPLLGVRPLLDQNGVLHQLMRLGADELVFRALKLPGTPAEQRSVPGPWLSSGAAAFRDGKRRRLPWDDAIGRAEYSVTDGEFLLPLLALGEPRFLLASCTGRTSLVQFLSTDAPPADARGCTLQFTPATRSLVPLGKRVMARSAWDIVPFVHRGRLHVYAAHTNECWSWELTPGAAA